MEKLRKQRPAGAQQQQQTNYTPRGNAGNPSRPYSAKNRHSSSNPPGQPNEESGRPKYAHAHNFRGYRTNAKPTGSTKSAPEPTPAPDAGSGAGRYSQQRPMPTPRAEPWAKSDAQSEFNKATANFAAANKAADSAAEKLRQFNKQFYKEFQKAQASGGSGVGGAGGSRPSTAREPKYKQSSAGSIPSKPVSLRFTHRDDSTVTLVWDAGESATQGHNVAYELQWRERGKSISEWNTSPTLIVSLSCRKKVREGGRKSRVVWLGGTCACALIRGTGKLNFSPCHHPTRT